jgi:signal transduction histidine kinase
MAQAGQLGRILDNLMTNGLMYSERPARLLVASCREGEKAVVRVADNGVGIPDGEAERVFEPFYRNEDPAFQHVPETGLGLYISRHLAESHGGSLLLESSQLDRGSTFVLSLPLLKVMPGEEGTEPTIAIV